MIPRRYVYIDTENVSGEAWVPFLYKLSAKDTVYLFYTKNSKPLYIADVTKLRQCQATIEMIEVSTLHKNALDFVLVSYLSQKVMTAKKSIHWIVAEDKGYSSAIQFLVEQGATVQRGETLENIRKSLM